MANPKVRPPVSWARRCLSSCRLAHGNRKASRRCVDLAHPRRGVECSAPSSGCRPVFAAGAAACAGRWRVAVRCGLPTTAFALLLQHPSQPRHPADCAGTEPADGQRSGRKLRAGQLLDGESPKREAEPRSAVVRAAWHEWVVAVEYSARRMRHGGSPLVPRHGPGDRYAVAGIRNWSAFRRFALRSFETFLHATYLSRSRFVIPVDACPRTLPTHAPKLLLSTHRRCRD